MFKVGDIVEFWLGKKYRHGELLRKEKNTCFILGICPKYRRVYKIPERKLNYYRGDNYVKNQYW